MWRRNVVGLGIPCIDYPLVGAYNLLLPLRVFAWCTGGFIYTIWRIVNIPLLVLIALICLREGVDFKYYSRCSNSRNFIIFSFIYKEACRIFIPLRITWPIVKILTWPFENLYLIPCPILRAETFLDPVTHPACRLCCSYKSIFDTPPRLFR